MAKIGLDSLVICVKFMGSNISSQHLSGHVAMGWQSQRSRPSNMVSLCYLDSQNISKVGNYNCNGCCLVVGVECKPIPSFHLL
jgi:hypothetical protein